MVCLQEIKATPDQVPLRLCELARLLVPTGTAQTGYSGVALLRAQGRCAGAAPAFGHPTFDLETRIVTADGRRP